MTATAPAPTYTPVPIGELCEFLNGGTPSKANVDFWDGDIPWITSAEINDGEVAPPRFKITQDAIDESSTRLVPAGTLLLVIRTGVGKVGIAPYDLTFNQDINAVLPNPKRLDKQYLRRFLESQGDHFEKFSRGATVKGITREHLGRLAIPIPFPDDPRRSLAEQKRIAAILDKADAIRRRRQQAARLADTLIPSVFYEMFGDPVSPSPKGRVPTRPSRFGDLVRIRTGKLDANASSSDGQYPFFTCAVAPLRIDHFAFDAKAVLVAGNGDLNVKYYEGKFNAYQRTYVIESTDEELLDPRFMYAFLDRYVAELRRQSIGGVIKYIKLGYLTEALIHLPSREGQVEFVEASKVIERTRDAVQERCGEVETFFNALVQRAFRGEL